MIESLNKNAVDTMTARRTSVCSIAFVSVTAKRSRRSASVFNRGRRCQIADALREKQATNFSVSTSVLNCYR
jgi:hypothetical protein